jgi:serine/threonine-protein kinase HipA
MADFEVHIDLDNHTRPIGVARCNRLRGTEVILFEYDRAWLNDPDHFALEPALTLTRGTFAPPAGLATFGSIGDSAPDTWGRRLMQRVERCCRLLSESSETKKRMKIFSSYSLQAPPSAALGPRRQLSTNTANSQLRNFRRRPMNTASRRGRQLR